MFTSSLAYHCLLELYGIDAQAPDRWGHVPQRPIAGDDNNLPDKASPWGETGSASGVKWTTAVCEMTHLYAVSPDDV